ncbi:MAG: DUF1566 domain-containing protein, partial [Proteobacteria bacterium]|nr:DUF1566 domain-containing protein [Pseudomonadota bacterium]
MKTTRGLLLAMLVVGMFAFLACGNRKEAAPGSTTECDGGQLDPATNLCWQNPPPDDKLNWEAAKAYCDGLSLGGHDDWRLPKIHELNSIVRGCVNGTASGDLRKSKCGVADPGCLG